MDSAQLSICRNRQAATISMEQNSVGFDVPEANPNPVFRPVEGWVDLLCADLGIVVPGSGILQTLWYNRNLGINSLVQRVGSCASFASNPLAAAYKDLPGSSTQRCADLPGGTSSMGFTRPNGVRTAVLFPTNCVSRISVALRSAGNYPGYAGYRILRGSEVCANSIDGNGWSNWFDVSNSQMSFRNITCEYAELNPAANPSRAAPTPLAPSLLTARVSQSNIILNWRDNSVNEGNMVVERALGSGPFIVIRALNANAVTLTDTNVTPGSSYLYRIRAYNSAEYYSDGGYSPYSNQVSIATNPPPGLIPNAPSALVLTGVTTSVINLAWNDNSNNESSFSIERALGSGAFAMIGSAANGVRAINIPGLAAGTIYRFRIRAANPAGYSAYSNELSASTSPIPVVLPLAPSGLSLTSVSATAVDLAWNDNSNNESYFSIEQAGVSGAFAVVGSANAGIRAIRIGVLASTSYRFRVRAYNSAGFSGYSNELGVTSSPPPVLLPAAPSGLVPTSVTPSAVGLTWNDNSSNETTFSVERAQGSGAFAMIGTAAAGVRAIDMNGLAGGTSYRFRVRARNSAGYSGYSNEISVITPLPPPPAAPSTPTLVLAQRTSLRIQWIDLSNSEAGFEIRRALDSASPVFETVGSVGAGVIQFTDYSVAPGTRYRYRIRAYNSAGNGVSLPFIVSTLP